jgi:hypothetical protein
MPPSVARLLAHGSTASPNPYLGSAGQGTLDACEGWRGALRVQSIIVGAIGPVQPPDPNANPSLKRFQPPDPNANLLYVWRTHLCQHDTQARGLPAPSTQHLALTTPCAEPFSQPHCRKESFVTRRRKLRLTWESHVTRRRNRQLHRQWSRWCSSLWVSLLPIQKSRRGQRR